MSSEKKQVVKGASDRNHSYEFFKKRKYTSVINVLGAVHDFWGCNDLGEILVFSFTITSKLHKLPEHQFSHLVSGNKNNTYFTDWIRYYIYKLFSTVSGL